MKLLILCMAVVGLLAGQTVTTQLNAYDVFNNQGAKDNLNFTQQAFQNTLFTAELSKLAQQKSRQTRIVKFAGTVAGNCAEVHVILKELVKYRNANLPVTLSAQQMIMKEELATISEDKFEQQYIAMMIAEHQNNIALFKKHLQSSEQGSVKNFIIETLPVLTAQRDSAEIIQQQFLLRLK